MPVLLARALRRALAAAALPAAAAQAQAQYLTVTPPPVPPPGIGIPDGYLSRIVREYTFAGCAAAGNSGNPSFFFSSGVACLSGRAVWGVRADGGPPVPLGENPRLQPYTLMLTLDRTFAYPISGMDVFLVEGRIPFVGFDGERPGGFSGRGRGTPLVGSLTTFEFSALWGQFGISPQDPEGFRLTRIAYTEVPFGPLDPPNARTEWTFINIPESGIQLVQTVPEPSAVALTAAGLAAAGAASRRRRRACGGRAPGAARAPGARRGVTA